MANDVFKRLEDEIMGEIKDDLKLCEEEQDPIKKTKLFHKMQITLMHKMIETIVSVSDKDFMKIYEKLTNPTEKQFNELIKNEKNIAYRKIENAEEFEKHSKIQNLELKQNNAFADLLGEYDFNKKSLERLLLFYITILGQTEIEQRLTDTYLYPLIESALLVNRLFGFDINWLMGMSIIQLHENMIKKKYDLLGGKIKENESLYKIIPKLINLIKNKESRDVTLQLDMSQGLKEIRNRLTHEGFKHNISSDDLQLLLTEIRRLEQTLYTRE